LRKEVPMIITVLAGLVLIFSQFFHYGQVLDLSGVVDRWVQISQAFAILVGALNLTRIHGLNIQRRRENWIYSIVLLVCLWGYTALGIFEPSEGILEGPIFSWIYDGIVIPLDSTMYGSIAFFITSAAYRAFRVRSREATVLMIAAIVVALGQAPIGDAMINGWNSVAQWIVDYPATGALRGIQLGAFLGGLATALRILLGLERAHLGTS